MTSIIECSPGKVLETFYKKEMWHIEKEWMRVFASNSQGANTKAYKWHAFSYEVYPSVSGEKAREEYRAHEATEYYVMANDEEFTILTDQKPEECNLQDYYVFPKNFAWSMAFTHEDGWLGPYFSRHPDYEALNSENLKKIKKEKQKENARNKGWI